MTAEAGNNEVATPENTTENVQGTETTVDNTATAEPTTEASTETEANVITPDPNQTPEWFENRMKRFTAQKYKQEAKIQELEQKLAEATAERQPTLTREDFGEDTEGWTEHLVESKAQELFIKQQQQQMAQQQQYQAAMKATQSWEAKIKEVSASLPDYQSVVSQADIELPPDVVQDIMDSDKGPEIAYHLAKNPNEADKLASLNERSRNRYLARLEIQLENTPTTPIAPGSPKVSQASAPNATPKGTGSQQTQSLEDWIKSRNEEDRKRGML